MSVFYLKKFDPQQGFAVTIIHYTV